MTAQEIIARSLSLHRSLFEEFVSQGLSADLRYAATMRLAPRTHSAVMGRAGNHEFILETLRNETPAEAVTLICRETGPAVIALAIACRLQCLPPHVHSEAAATLEAAA